MIIVEGPDGAGKSTLVQYLSEKWDLPVADRVVASNTAPIIDDLKHWVEVNLKRGLQWQLFDRHRLISEPIYAAALHRKAQPGFDDLQWMTARMIDFTRIHPFIIYCLPPWELVESNLAGDVNNSVIWHHAQTIYNAYITQAAGDIARGQAVLFDYHQDSAHDRIDMLFHQWQRTHKDEILRKCSRVVR